jgi:hypothetical protein
MAIYLALGDSISIDDYTGVPDGGAASQLARQAYRTMNRQKVIAVRSRQHLVGPARPSVLAKPPLGIGSGDRFGNRGGDSGVSEGGDTWRPEQGDCRANAFASAISARLGRNANPPW